MLMTVLSGLRFIVLLAIAHAIQYALTEFRFEHKKTLRIAVFTFVIVSITGFLCLLMIGVSSLGKIYPLLINIPSFLIYLYLSKYRNFKFVFSYMTSILICGVVVAAGLIGEMVFAGTSGVIADILVRLMIGVPLIFCLYGYFRPLYRSMLRMLDRGWALFCLMPFAFYWIFYILFMRHAASTDDLALRLLLVLLALSMMVVAYAIICIFFMQIKRQAEITGRQALLKSQVAALSKQTEAIYDSMEQTRILKHDMRHYLKSASTLLRSGEIEKALDFLDSIDSDMEKSKLQQFCENPVVNAILSFYAEKARQEGIPITMTLDIRREIPMKDTELSVVLANAIENAIHACMEIPPGQKREITVTCTSSPKFALEIANPCTNAVFDREGKPVSSEEGHGLGTKSIEAVANQYNALLDYEVKDGIFRMRMLIQ